MDYIELRKAQREIWQIEVDLKKLNEKSVKLNTKRNELIKKCITHAENITLKK